MALVTWDPSFSVKVARCDEDHKKLFSLINTLHEAMLAGKGSEKIKQVVSELSNYTKFHFSAEEALLEKTKYGALAAHKMQHQEFVKKVEDFQKDVAAGKTANSASVLNFMKDWLTRHIKQTDQKYAEHLNANGVH